MKQSKEDTLNAIINNLEGWDWKIRPSFSFEQHECELILELAKRERTEMRRFENECKQRQTV